METTAILTIWSQDKSSQVIRWSNAVALTDKGRRRTRDELHALGRTIANDLLGDLYYHHAVNIL